MRGGRNRPEGRGSAVTADARLDAAAYERLAQRCATALARARRRGRAVVASVTVPISAAIDPLARVSATRGDECWSCFEQSAHGERCVATLGEVAVVDASGDDRFDVVARRCAEWLDGAEADDPADDPASPPGAGVIWTGGFAFFADQRQGEPWGDMPAARFALPAVSIARGAGEARLTVNCAVSPDDDLPALLAGAERMVGRLGGGPADDDPRARGARSEDPTAPAPRAQSTSAPEHFERAVAQALELIAAGEIEKVVLSREVTLRRSAPLDVAAALLGLRARFPDCMVFALGAGGRTFLGATPELLIRREGRRASTLALAGSTRRGADDQTDRHLGEQLLASAKDNREHALVVRRIERTLGRRSAWTAVGERPELVKVHNIQHLATPIRAQLTEPRPVIELAGMLHPTPAVGGEPWPRAAAVIRSLEGFNRGWFAGGVGWMDLLEDGEFHVALRSALVQDDCARLFAGAGIVAGSEPATELAETEIKLEALLPILSRA